MEEYTIAEPSLRDKKLQVCIWSAEMRSIGRIVRLYREKYDEEILNKRVWQIRHTKKWIKVIGFLRGRMLKDLMAIPIANKAIRLRNLQKIYNECMTERVIKTGEFGDVYGLQVGAAIKANEAARVEIEGEKPSVKIEEHLHLTVVGKLHDLARKGLNVGV